MNAVQASKRADVWEPTRLDNGEGRRFHKDMCLLDLVGRGPSDQEHLQDHRGSGDGTC